MARRQAPEDIAPEASARGVSTVSTSRGRRFVRLFLMTAGGLAAPCLALAAFFLSNGGESESPAKAAGVVQSGRATTTTTAPSRTTATAPSSTTTTTMPALPLNPPRDPFAPLVTQAPPGGTPAR